MRIGNRSQAVDGTVFNDLERLLTQISRSRQYSTLTISLTVQDWHYFIISAYNGQLVKTFHALLIGMFSSDVE